MRNSPLLLSLLVIGAASCGEDQNSVTEAPATEHGRWGIVGATRDGSATATLDGVYVEFDTGRAVMTSNLDNGSVITSNYVIDAEALLTPDNPLFQRMELRELTDSTLVLAMNIQRSFFVMSFRPEAAPAEAPVLVRPEAMEDVPADDDPREGGDLQ